MIILIQCKDQVGLVASVSRRGDIGAVSNLILYLCASMLTRRITSFFLRLEVTNNGDGGAA